MADGMRSAFVIARRDFTATVFSKAFLLFLIGPLFPLLMGVIFGGLGSTLAKDDQPVVAVVMAERDFAAIEGARQRLAGAFSERGLVRLRHVAPAGDPAKQRATLLQSDGAAVLGVLGGTLDAPSFHGSVAPDGHPPRALQLLIDEARQPGAGAAASGRRLAVTRVDDGAAALASGRTLTARAGQALLFLLTILLAGMLLSQLIEEKSNKVIEVLASAVPVDSIFLGKLFAMLAMSLLGIAVWTGLGAAAIALYAEQGLGALPPPAVGWPVFLALALLYFAMSYLLLGSAFLAIGSQASTVREVQTLSMPVTMAQVVVFSLAALAVGEPDSGRALAAAAFPLSSPFVMIARAAEQAALWPHLVALAWQASWVALIVRLGARLFRSSVLKSGPARPFWRRWSRR